MDEVDLIVGFSPSHIRLRSWARERGEDPARQGSRHLNCGPWWVHRRACFGPREKRGRNDNADRSRCRPGSHGRPRKHSTPPRCGSRRQEDDKNTDKSGADVDRRTAKVGHTALHMCSSRGHADAVRELLRARANALLTTPPSSGMPVVPLELAAAFGHVNVVRELVRQLGIDRCGGANRGETVLQIAAQDQCVGKSMGILAALTEAGAVDTGVALNTAACYAREAAAKFLLQQQEARDPTGTGAYLQARDAAGRTPLFCCIAFCQHLRAWRGCSLTLGRTRRRPSRSRILSSSAPGNPVDEASPRSN